jgi:hypothetical protein
MESATADQRFADAFTNLEQYLLDDGTGEHSQWPGQDRSEKAIGSTKPYSATTSSTSPVSEVISLAYMTRQREISSSEK